MAWLRLHLIADWRKAHRFWSSRLMLVGLIAQLIPAETFLQLYALVPSDIQPILPGRTVIVAVCFVLAFIARHVNQSKLHDDDQAG